MEDRMATRRAFWQDRWTQGNTPWNLGAPHPQTITLLAKAGEFGPGRGDAWIPGCGHGHDAAPILARGYTVHFSDLIPEAVASARETFGSTAGTSFAVEDICSPPGDSRQFDLIFDRAVLCALSPEQVRLYVKHAAQRLRARGLFLSHPFGAVSNSEGPPYPVPLEELRELMAPHFRLVWSCDYDSVAGGGKVLREYGTIWIRVD